MAKDQNYTAADIEDLGDREHVRLRTQIYLGSMSPTTYQIPILTESSLAIQEVEFIPAVYKAIGEVVDNCLDEFQQITARNKTLKIDAIPEAGQYTIIDNGRGIPIEQKVDRHGKQTWVPELVLSRLRSGRNFKEGKEVGVIGQNGVGAACTNYCSSEFEVIVHRDKKKYHQKFIDGVEKVSRPKITDSVTHSGTSVSFQLDPSVFKDVRLPDALIRNRAIEIAMTNPDVTVEYNGTKYRYKKGLQEVVGQIAGEKASYCFSINEENITGEIYVIFNAHDGVDEQMFTWVNSSLLFDGGKCNTQFMNALTASTISHLERQAKIRKVEVTKNDVKRGLMILANLKVKNPEYDSQAKTRLTGPDVRVEMVNSIGSAWKAFAKQASGWIDEVLEHAENRHHKKADKEAQDEHEKDKKKVKLIEGLLDATSRNRSACQLLITEGDSAKSQICEARDPETTAAFALTGKINNVRGCTIAQVLKMGKIKDLLAAIGLTPGKKAIRSDLNYGRITISTDADYDGDDIFTLLVNLMFQYWPELFDPKYEPIVHRLVAPNVCLVKGKQRIHFPRRADYEKVKDKYKGYEVRYYKGLGSMHQTDWEMVLSGKTDTNIPIIDDGNLDQTLELLFGKDADARKNWLTEKE